VSTVIDDQSHNTPSPAPAPDGDSGRFRLADGARVTGTVVGHLTDQARSTASAARAGRVRNSGDDPGLMDLTPLRKLLTDLVEELDKLRLRDRVAEALRQAADVIDSRTPNR
jgi:hypothetical protein